MAHNKFLSGSGNLLGCAPLLQSKSWLSLPARSMVTIFRDTADPMHRPSLLLTRTLAEPKVWSFLTSTSLRDTTNLCTRALQAMVC